MGKPHSYRKYKKALKNRNRHIWYSHGQKQSWPGNFHPKQAFNMLCLRPFYIPNNSSQKIANIFDLSKVQFDTLARPFLGVSYDKFKMVVGMTKDPAFDWRNIPTVSNKKEEKHTNAVSYAKSLGYYISTGEFGIKALSDGCFALLYIPNGAIVHVDGTSDVFTNYARSFYELMMGSQSCKDPYANSICACDDRWNDGIKETRKHRANKVYVVAVCKSVITRHEFVNGYVAGEKFEIELRDVREGRSIKDAQFKYIPDSWVSIDNYGIDGDDACDAGIHYFPGCNAAIKYHIDDTYARPYLITFSFMTTKDPCANSICACAENMLPKILPNWMEHKISEFKCIHDDIYEYYYDLEGRTLFDKLTRPVMEMQYKHTADLSEILKELNEAARALADKVQSWSTSTEIRSEESAQKPGFERAYFCKRMTGQPSKNTTILKPQSNLTIDIGCNIYNGIPAEDEEETEHDDDEPP